jgi:hypothetical protein
LCKGLRSLLRMTSKDRIPGYWSKKEIEQ